MISFRNSTFHSRVSFERAVMPGACFVGCNMADADFTCADLRGADFRAANIHKSCFVGANIEDAVGIVPLPVADPRPVRWVAIAHKRGWWIAAGEIWEHDFWLRTRDHWQEREPFPRSVKQTLPAALQWLQQIKPPSFEEIET